MYAICCLESLVLRLTFDRSYTETTHFTYTLFKSYRKFFTIVLCAITNLGIRRKSSIIKTMKN